MAPRRPGPVSGGRFRGLRPRRVAGAAGRFLKGTAELVLEVRHIGKKIQRETGERVDLRRAVPEIMEAETEKELLFIIARFKKKGGTPLTDEQIEHIADYLTFMKQKFKGLKYVPRFLRMRLALTRALVSPTEAFPRFEEALSIIVDQRLPSPEEKQQQAQMQQMQAAAQKKAA